jgi:DNA gyrase subunit A
VAISKVTDDDEVMLTTSGGIIIRTRVRDISTIGRNTQGVRLIKVDDGDTVGSLAKLPLEELTDVEAELAEVDADSPAAAPTPDAEPDHLLNDGVGPAEASTHLDDLDADGEPDRE